ncbi:MAG: hypothetical protein J1E41_02310 [Ruminococcus sp.]|nr:hypothetical protein [Ruminococcus sp.]
MIRISNLKLPIEYGDALIKKKVAKELRINENEIEKFSLFRRSIDARKKNDIHFLASIDVHLNTNENKVIAKAKSGKAKITTPYEYRIPDAKKLDSRPLVVGFGPAGMFAGLILALTGAKPIIIEQGKDCDSRVKDIESFIATGNLNTQSNIQFGEGGAGTFSDGKLNTGTKDSRARKVLIEFVNHGAPEEILYNAKPHIGTDNLRLVVKNIREKIIKLGGEVKFNTKLIELKTLNNRITGAVVKENGSENIIETTNIILAIGHSSRDTFKMLYDSNIIMEQKPFSVGARIEHLRKKIDKSQFGEFAGNERLGSASYKLNVQTKNGRGAYTFCMCPGGEVVPAASEKNMVCTNGMSEFSRNAVNSNAALLVSVTPKDFQSEHPLAGIEYQRKIEKDAFKFGGGNYSAPVQRVEDFLKNRKSTFLGDIKPSYKRGFEFASLDSFLPEYITDSMREAIIEMDKRLKGFANPDAVLTGAETRSSSPIRITRNVETLQSVSLKGLYPCGEGAGYAGGIVSAAVDGIKCAEKILTT